MGSNLETIILGSYFISLCVLFGFGLHGFIMVYHHLKHRNEATPMPKSLENE